MCQEAEQQKLHTQFQLHNNLQENQAQEFEYKMLDPQSLQHEVMTARAKKEGFLALRAQMQGVTLPTQQVREVIQPAPPQVEEPQPAPQETTWKERRAQRKQKDALLKRGKKLTKDADVLTISLFEKQKELNADNQRFTPPDDGGGAAVTPELTEVLHSMQGIRLSADLFTDEHFLDQYAFLRETLDKGAYIARIAENAALMEQLRVQDSSLYCTALYWQQAQPLLWNAFSYANISHGLNEDGEVLRTGDTAIPAHLRKTHLSNVLDDLRGSLAEQEQTHQQALSDELQRGYEQELARKKAAAQPPDDGTEQGWLHSPSLTYGSTDSFAEIQRLKTMIEANGEVYLANKDMVDQMFSDVIRQYEVLGELDIQRRTWGDLQGKYAAYHDEVQSDGHRLLEMATGRLSQLTRESSDIGVSLTAIKDAMAQLLQGGQPGLMETAVLSSYGYLPEAPLKQLASARARRSEWQEAALNRLIDRGDFTPANRESEFVTRAVTLFRQGDDAYNLQILNTLQKFLKEQNRPRPVQAEGMSNERFRELCRDDAEQRLPYYDTIRRLVEPQVERLLAWDMDRFLRMNDSELMAAQEELDDLFGANMFTADLMKLHYPYSEKHCMKDDLLGDRMEEFSHRISVLRGLTDKSRGLSLMALANLNVPIRDCLTNGENTNKLPGTAAKENLDVNSPKVTRIFAHDQFDLGTRFLDREMQRWSDRRNPDSQAFRNACMEQYQKRGTLGTLLQRDMPLTEASIYYERNFQHPRPNATQEELDAAKRLQNEDYRICCWDLLDARILLRERGLDPVSNRKQVFPTINEPFFRTFTSYIACPGAQTQTPEEFHQMVRDLSAGAELTRKTATPEEIFEARERNRQGCLQFKESLRLTYDYLGRKYGYGLETLSPLELYDHWEEILRDFNNVQVDLDFITKIPDIVDMNVPEDARLYHQVNYLSVFCHSVQEFMLFVGAQCSAEEAITMIRGVATGNDAGPHRAALRRLGANAGMADTVTWGNTVRVGQRRPLPPDDPEGREQRWQTFQRREASREQEAPIVELQQKWAKQEVYYPDQHTEQLYAARQLDNKILKAQRKVVASVLNARMERTAESNRRGDVFLRLLPPVQLNEKGELSPEDTKKIQKMTKDYFFGKEKARNAVVDTLIKGVCSLEFSPEMFSPTYVREHLLEMRHLDRCLSRVGFLINDHKEHFDQLPHETQELYRTVRIFSGKVGEWLNSTLELSGLGATEGAEIRDEPVTEEELLELREVQMPEITQLLALWGERRQAYLRVQGNQ